MSQKNASAEKSLRKPMRGVSSNKGESIGRTIVLTKAADKFKVKPVVKGLTSYLVEFEREDDGRWIADVPELPGVLVYGASKQEAMEKVSALAGRVVRDQITHGERPKKQFTVVSFVEKNS